MDFEGAPMRSLGARRIKRSPLRDVAGMLCSFRYAGQIALDRHLSTGGVAESHRPLLRQYADYWLFWVAVVFLEAYLQGVAERRLVPQDITELAALLDIHILESLIDDLGEELSCRPEEAGVPLDEILRFLGQS